MEYGKNSTARIFDSTSRGLHVKVTCDIKRRMRAILRAANRKKEGRDIKEIDLINLLLGLVTNDHIKTLQDASLDNMDRLNARYRVLTTKTKKQGWMTKDAFIGMLLAAENKQQDVSPACAQPVNQATSGI